MHRDAPSSAFRPQNSTWSQRLAARMRRDSIRVKAVLSKLRFIKGGFDLSDLKPVVTQGQTISVEDLQSPLASGLDEGSGEYFVSVGVGTPSRTINLVADTGSDVVWQQCSPCSNCYQQVDPLFNPAASSSFQQLSCSSQLCSQLRTRGCQSNQCLYQVLYGDGSFTVGVFSTETLQFGSNSVQNVAIGCGHNNQGLFVGASGLLGLGGGPLSFPTQVGSQYGSVFSYCLPDRLTSQASALIFGPSAVPAGSIFAPLVSNPVTDTFYYVGLTGIRVGGVPISVSSGAFQLDSSGNGGVILDSGTAVTRLVSSAYNAMSDAFRANTGSLPAASSVLIFDTCYDLSGHQSVRLPAVDLEFEGGAVVPLPANNLLVQTDDSGTFCLAFAPSDDNLSIIGNIQQQSLRISFDKQQGRVGFASNQCN
ncbi:hypothetical protein O6H91_07G002500 [Diphasiastrum complanatum]|nr:hypothetical protein O6H91_07G002500 [Diphasiastrum complanatum]